MSETAGNTKKIQMVDLVSQHLACKAELDESIQKVLSHGGFINGPEVKEFAKNLSAYLQSKFVIPCANGTDALQIALMALSLNQGDEVITTSFNYVAAAEATALLGLKPVFAEAAASSFNLDADLLEGFITERTRAIIVVHLFGQACDMEKIMSVAAKHNLFVIEDVAQSLGADVLYHGNWVKAGTIGHIGTTSFFPTKNLGCMGDGGAIFTDNEDLAQKCKSISAHGQGQRYEFQCIGINSRLDTLQAAMLNVKIKYLQSSLDKRVRVANKYYDLLKNVEQVQSPSKNTFSSHTYNQFVIKVKDADRDDLKKFLAEHEVPSMIYYPKPLHLQPAFQFLNKKEGDYPVSEQLCKQVLALPVHPELSEEQILCITDLIKTFLDAR